jgi:hypothetical protein
VHDRGAGVAEEAAVQASLTAGVSGFHVTKGVASAVGAEWSAAELAILRTVLYASLFEYPLTLGELHQTLLESSLTSKEILRTYNASPRLRAGIEHSGGCFVPAGRTSWIAQRRRREARSWALVKRHRRLLALLRHLPYVRMVALSGSVAASNADKGADLDLFVVTKGPRVWLITLAVIALAKLLGQRRVVCLNFVVSDHQLSIAREDLFAANQIIHLRPLSGPETFQAFLDANPFVRRFYPNFTPEDRLDWLTRANGWDRVGKPILEALLWVPSRAMDRLSRLVYGRHLRRRSAAWRSPEQVMLGPECLKLHTQSHRQKSLDRFERLLATYLSVY